MRESKSHGGFAFVKRVSLCPNFSFFFVCDRVQLATKDRLAMLVVRGDPELMDCLEHEDRKELRSVLVQIFVYLCSITVLVFCSNC